MALRCPMMFNGRLSRRRPPLSRPPPPRPLARVLDSDARFAEWTARHREEAALTRLVRRHLPRPIGERIHVTDARAGTLELAASAGAIAAALRQRAPDLRRALARDGWTLRKCACGCKLQAQRTASRRPRSGHGTAAPPRRSSTWRIGLPAGLCRTRCGAGRAGRAVSRVRDAFPDPAVALRGSCREMRL